MSISQDLTTEVPPVKWKEKPKWMTTHYKDSAIIILFLSTWSESEDHTGTNNNVEHGEFNFPLWFQNPNTHVNIIGVKNRGPTWWMKRDVK
jgi:hypothetical protein